MAGGGEANDGETGGNVFSSDNGSNNTGVSKWYARVITDVERAECVFRGGEMNNRSKRRWSLLSERRRSEDSQRCRWIARRLGSGTVRYCQIVRVIVQNMANCGQTAWKDGWMGGPAKKAVLDKGPDPCQTF